MPTDLVVVIPTVSGREDLLERTKQGWRDSMRPGDPELRLVVVRDRVGIGRAWADGLRTALELEPRAGWVVLAADDTYPMPAVDQDDAGWFRVTVARALRGIYPSPHIVNADGSVHSTGTMGAGMLVPGSLLSDDLPAGTSPFPFLLREWARELLAAGIPDVHYYADDWVAWVVRRRFKVDPRTVRGYRLMHLEGSVARPAMQRRAMADRQAVLDRMGEW